MRDTPAERSDPRLTIAGPDEPNGIAPERGIREVPSDVEPIVPPLRPSGGDSPTDRP